ncbi:MAG: 2-hydroxymuconate-semialdehyde hydrolase [Mycobacterium sp.]|nr:2-hydroxymuconate-semialdehyde hydrolase [Mycobacterium sp.]
MTTSSAVPPALMPRTIEAGGITTAYLQAGYGDPVLMLHGSGPGVSATANWQNNIPVLAEKFHVLAPDIVGFGGTERPADIVYSLRAWTDHAWAFLDAHSIEKTAIVGNSLGGASHCRWPPIGPTGSPGWS